MPSFWHTVIQGCWERGEAKLYSLDLLGEPVLETLIKVVCLPIAAVASLPSSKAVNYQLLLLWSCSVDVLLDHRQGTNPNLRLYSPSGVTVKNIFFVFCLFKSALGKNVSNTLVLTENEAAAGKSFTSKSKDIPYIHPDCLNEFLLFSMIAFLFTGSEELKFKNGIQTVN